MARPTDSCVVTIPAGTTVIEEGMYDPDDNVAAASTTQYLFPSTLFEIRDGQSPVLSRILTLCMRWDPRNFDGTKPPFTPCGTPICVV